MYSVRRISSTLERLTLVSKGCRNLLRISVRQESTGHAKDSHKEFNTSSGAEEEHARTHRVYDVVIAGGGLVGAAMACTLGSNPLFWDQDILILEAAKQLKTSFSSNSQYSNRVSSITPGSKKLFEKIGVWEYIEDMRYKPYSAIHVWDSCGNGNITFDTSEMSLPEASTDIAYIIENQVILSALYQKINQMSDLLQVKYGKVIEDISVPVDMQNSDHLSIELTSGEVIKTKLLVAADGANSSIRKKSSMAFINKEYDQHGVVATLGLEKPTENTMAWQRFLPTGPIASLPLSETKSSLVWSTSPTLARELVKLSEERFVDAVNNAFWEDNERHPIVNSSSQLMEDIVGTLRPGAIAKNRMLVPPAFKKVYKGSRASFPLGLGHATNYVKSRVALIGDAAHRVHPLAGQGVNLGFADAAALTKVIGRALETGADIGNLNNLLEYETERQREVVPMIAAIDGLQKLFSTDAMPLVLARTLGLQATNALHPIKEQIMAFAMK